MKKLFPILPLFLFLLVGCAASQEPVSADFFAMDTAMSVTAYGNRAQEAVVAVQREINRLDGLWSANREGSDIAQINTHAGDGSAVPIDPSTAQLLRSANAAAQESGMAFNPVLSPVLNAWGFPTKDYRLPTQSELSALLPLTHDLPTVKEYAASLPLPGQSVDVGGIAKGAASQQVWDLLREYGIDSAFASLGTSNILTVGAKPDGAPWRVAVRDPQSPGNLLCVFSMADTVCATSGGYERYFEEDGVIYRHIIDPDTGYPAESGLTSVTVVSPHAVDTDAWSTALYVMGLREALDYWRAGEGAAADMELILVTEDRVYVTEGLSQDFEFLGEEAGYTYEIVSR